MTEGTFDMEGSNLPRCWEGASSREGGGGLRAAEAWQPGVGTQDGGELTSHELIQSLQTVRPGITHHVQMQQRHEAPLLYVKF